MHSDGFLWESTLLGVSSLPLTNTVSPLEGTSSLLMYPKPLFFHHGFCIYQVFFLLSTLVPRWKISFIDEEGLLVFLYFELKHYFSQEENDVQTQKI